MKRIEIQIERASSDPCEECILESECAKLPTQLPMCDLLNRCMNAGIRDVEYVKSIKLV